MDSKWRPLSYATTSKPLFVRTLFRVASYTISITDLTSLWAEEASRDDIIRRAQEASSDIHPEDDASQMEILLDKISGAFAKEGEITFVGPLVYKLQLFMTISLPGDLNDLQWSLSLVKQPPSELQSQVTNAVLANVYLHKQQIDHMARLLHEKDDAISKILDKVESLGLDFGTVFPNARLNRKGNLRDQVLKQVKGLQRFDEESFVAELRMTDYESLSPQEILGTALAESSGSHVVALAQRLPVYGGGSSPMPQRVASPVVPDRRPGLKDASLSQSQTDAFQRQKTPEIKRNMHQPSPSPTLPSKQNDESAPSTSNKTQQEAIEDDDSTEDEDDLDAGMVTDNPTPSYAHRTPQKMISEASSTVSPSEKTSSSAVAQHHKSDWPEDKRSTTPTPLSIQKSARQVTPDPPQRRGKLGKIGGRQAVAPEPKPTSASEVRMPPADEDTAMTDVPRIEENVPRARPKLGRIGGARAHAAPAVSHTSKPVDTASDTKLSSSDRENEVVQSIEQTPKPEPSPKRPEQATAAEPEEDPKVKADRKREALKRELNSSKTTVKKKRKF